MKAKRKLGMGMKNSQPKKGKGFRRKRKSKAQKRIILTPKRGGFLPLLLPILGALGAMAGGAAGMAEMKRHNLVLEIEKKKGKELYLAPYKKNPPKPALTNVDLSHFAKKIKIQNFEGYLCEIHHLQR